MCNIKELGPERLSETCDNVVVHRILEYQSKARDAYERLELDAQRVLASGNEVRVLTWRGDAVNDTLTVGSTRWALPR